MSTQPYKDTNSLCLSEIRTFYPEFVSLLAKKRDDILGISAHSRWDLARVGANPARNFERVIKSLDADHAHAETKAYRDKLFQIREAIIRMREGLYGLCKVCLSQLPFDELRTAPEKACCTNCSRLICGDEPPFSSLSAIQRDRDQTLSAHPT